MKAEREVSEVGGVRLIVRGSDGSLVEIVLLGGRAVRGRVDRSGGSADMSKTTARSLLHAHDHRAWCRAAVSVTSTIAPQVAVYSTYCEIDAARKPLCVCRPATGTFVKPSEPPDNCFYGKPGWIAHP